ncbi:MAG: STAS domain-containing protein [Myxococcales bacterium]|nr:STAS domain-containing protein [Myxococcales bacterium]
MKIRQYKQGVVTVLEPEEPILDAGVAAMERVLDECIEAGDQKIVVDMGKVAFVESAGLETLVTRAARLTERGGALKIANPSEICREVLRVTRLGRVLEVYESTGEARKSFL